MSPPGEEASQVWLESSEVVALFPTFVWKVQLLEGPQRDIQAKILTVLETSENPVPELARGQSWQSEQSLHQREQLGELVVCIRHAARTVLRFLRIGYDAFEITACWANVNAPGAAHQAHSHPNNFLSGSYYVQTQPGADTINFHDPRVQTAVLRPPVTELSAENADQAVLRVRDGSLLLFPAYLEHSVDPNRSERNRISLSFNIMFSAFTENLSKPLWGGD